MYTPLYCVSVESHVQAVLYSVARRCDAAGSVN